MHRSGKGIIFNPRPRLAGNRGNGLFLRAGSRVYYLGLRVRLCVVVDDGQ